MVCLVDYTENIKTLSVARIMIDTCVGYFIKGWIFLSMGKTRCDIYICEIGNSITSKP